MPLDTQTYELESEVERIRGEIDDLADEASGYDAGTPHFEQAEAEATRLNMHLNGLEWALDAWDVENVTLGALSAGEYARMERYIPDDGTQQARRNVFVAIATVEAPYATESVEDTIVNVADDCHPYFTRWAEDRANTLLRGGSGNTNPFYASLREKTNQET